MAHTHDIREGMEVIGSDGGLIGRVLGLHGDHIHVEPTAPVHANDHIFPRTWVARVDDHVHLDRDAALVRQTWGASDRQSAATHTAPAATAARSGIKHEAAHSGVGKSWIVWAIGAVLLLLIIVLMIRGFGYAASDSDMSEPAVDAPAA